jgi:hypothetical protein
MLYELYLVLNLSMALVLKCLGLDAGIDQHRARALIVIGDHLRLSYQDGVNVPPF